MMRKNKILRLPTVSTPSSAEHPQDQSTPDVPPVAGSDPGDPVQLITVAVDAAGVVFEDLGALRDGWSVLSTRHRRVLIESSAAQVTLICDSLNTLLDKGVR